MGNVPLPLPTRAAGPSTNRSGRGKVVALARQYQGTRCPGCGQPPVPVNAVAQRRAPGRLSMRAAANLREQVTPNFLRAHRNAAMSFRNIDAYHGIPHTTLFRLAKQLGMPTDMRQRR